MLLFEHFSIWWHLCVAPFSVICGACELNWLHWRSGHRPLRESPCHDPLASLNLLLSLVTGRDHQVIIWIHVLEGGRLALDGGRFAVHAGDLQHPAGVVFQQVPCESLPAASHAHHDVLVVQHLQWKESRGSRSGNPQCASSGPAVLHVVTRFCLSDFLCPVVYRLHRVCTSLPCLKEALFVPRRWIRDTHPETQPCPAMWVRVCVWPFDWLKVSGGFSLTPHIPWQAHLCPRLLLLPEVSASFSPTRLFPFELGLKWPRECLLLNRRLIITQILDTK